MDAKPFTADCAEITSDTPALFKTPAVDFAPWKQPLGGHDAYAKGAKVTHKELRWESTADNNVWEPGVYGWVKI